MGLDLSALAVILSDGLPGQKYAKQSNNKHILHIFLLHRAGLH